MVKDSNIAKESKESNFFQEKRENSFLIEVIRTAVFYLSRTVVNKADLSRHYRLNREASSSIEKEKEGGIGKR